MSWFSLFVVFLLGFLLGYALCAYVVSQDENLVRLQADERIIKKPDDGLVLVAVTPDMMRKFVAQREFDASEARNLYQKGVDPLQNTVQSS